MAWQNKNTARNDDIETKIPKRTFKCRIKLQTQNCRDKAAQIMSENSFNVGSESFIRSTAFIIECVKASIYKELDLDHPMNSLIDIVTKVTIDENDQLQGSVDPRVIYELSERIDNDPEPEVS